MDLKDKVAVISGGVSGLGEATARLLLGAGAKVALMDLNEEAGAALVSELGDATVFCKTDVTDGESVETAVNQAVDAFGAVHVAVNCAGVGWPAKVVSKKGPMDINFFNQVVQVNLIGTMNVIRLAAVKMMDNEPNEDGEKGVMINTASVAAFDGQIGQAAYSASKAGVVGMTLPIAREFASYGIRIMTIAPGLFRTPMLAALPENVQESLGQSVPFPKRLGFPAEFAQLTRQIIENPMLNGEVIRLDGALRMQAR